ncbi:MAG: hypothetical protein DRG83_06630 [Deltaproteobacteria bacterium]|nr:MAG: hypothetical protein DRG83_06630 [Deltaproteobacteria bacterium]
MRDFQMEELVQEVSIARDQQRLSSLLKHLVSTKWFILALFGLMLFVRLIFLTADPPLLQRYHFNTDEGWWVHNARNKVLFGDWILDDYNTMFYAPLYNYIAYLIFNLLGIGFVQVRLISVTFGFSTLIVFYFFLKEGWNKKGALIGVSLLGFSHVFLRYNRIALPETVMIFFIVVTLFFWQRGNKSNIYSLFAGVSSIMAYFSKYQAVFLFPLILFLWGFEKYKSDPQSWKRKICYFSFGVILTLGSWVLLFIYPNYADFKVATSRMVAAHTIHSFLDIISRPTWFATNPILGQVPILLALSLLSVVYTMSLAASGLKKFLSKVNLIDFVALSWLLCGSVLVSILHAPPDRRYLILIPPMCILVTRLLAEPKEIDVSGFLKSLFVSKKGTVSKSLWIFMLLFPIYITAGYGLVILGLRVFGYDFNSVIILNGRIYQNFCLVVLFLTLIAGLMIFKWSITKPDRLFSQLFLLSFCLSVLAFGIPISHVVTFLTKLLNLKIGKDVGLDYSSASLVSLLLILLATLLIIVLRKYQGKAFLRLYLNPRFSSVLLGLFFLVNSSYYISYIAKPSFTMVNTSRKLRNYFRYKTRVIGGIADTLCLENEAFAFTPYDYNINSNSIERFDPEFALIKVYRYGHGAIKKPEYMTGKERLLERFYLCPFGNPRKYRFVVELYTLKEGIKNSQSVH